MNRRKFLVASAATSALCAVHSSAYAGLFEESQQAATPKERLSPALVEPTADQFREKLRRDPLRPQFHLLAKANWMNDPCAPRFFRGHYHMFFQSNPGAAVWGDMHWSHAISPDLIYWKHMPMALSPTPGSYDADGCFTGSVFPDGESATVLYTAVSRSTVALETIRGRGLREVQCLATSTDADLRTWKKLDKPVLDSPPPGLKITGFRDPCPWKDGDIWYLGLGSGFPHVGGAVLLYRSTDGRNWTYLHPLAQGNSPADTGEMWECPDFFPVRDKHVLLYSAKHKVHWEVGTFDRRELLFHSETRGLLDHGSYYAAKSMVDAKGRRILWGWVEETRSAEECVAAGWAGAMALPRVLTLGSDNELRMEVPPEFHSLRHNVKSLQKADSTETVATALANLPIQTRAGMVVCTFKAGERAFGLELGASGQSAPLFAIKYDNAIGKPAVTIADQTLPLSPDRDGISTLNLWMDGSVIETFVDNKAAMTARCYAPSSGDLHLAWSGETAALKSLTVSGVTPISDDRLTT
jgi:beta-fructofuranosidase